MHSPFCFLLAFILASCAFPSTASIHVHAEGVNKGRATVYLPAHEEGGGRGHCTGVMEKNEDIVTAIRGKDYRRLKKEGIDVCNMCVQFTGKVVSHKAGKVGSTRSILARIVDICEGSGCHHFDMSLGAFRKFQGVEVRNGKPIDDGPGYVDIHYEIVKCKSSHGYESQNSGRYENKGVSKYESKSSDKHGSKSSSKHDSKSSDRHKSKSSDKKKCSERHRKEKRGKVMGDKYDRYCRKTW